jgi:hypothetical protein
MLRLYLLPLVIGALATTATAQTIVVNPRQSMAPVSTEQVRVTVNLNTFVAAPTDSSEEAVKAQEAGRRLVYGLAAHECAVLLELFAADCRLESVNVNVQRAPGNQFAAQQRAEGFNVNGSVGFRIAPK